MSTLHLRPALVAGKFYRNDLGKVVRIRELQSDEPGFNKGFRFIDHRGTCYMDRGSVNSRMWHRLNLIAEVPAAEVSKDEIDLIVSEGEVYLKTIDRMDAIKRYFRSLKPSSKKMAPFIAAKTLGNGIAIFGGF